MRYSIDLVKHVFICGWNDSAIENPFRWYEDCGLQLVYNYGRVESDNQIICSMNSSNWITIIERYKQQLFLCENE